MVLEQRELAAKTPTTRELAADVGHIPLEGPTAAVPELSHWFLYVDAGPPEISGYPPTSLRHENQQISTRPSPRQRALRAREAGAPTCTSPKQPLLCKTSAFRRWVGSSTGVGSASTFAKRTALRRRFSSSATSPKTSRSTPPFSKPALSWFSSRSSKPKTTARRVTLMLTWSSRR